MSAAGALPSFALFFALLLAMPPGAAGEWIRAGLNTNQPIWGLKGGLQFALYPAGFRGREGGPRGLIRLGYPILTNGTCDLVNFVAVEPVVQGRKGFSELEKSALDARPGKRLWISTAEGTMATNNLFPGQLSRTASGAEELELVLRLERFENGAHVYLILTQHSASPDEIQFTVHAEPDSAPLEYCILTATMGNMARARQLWLKGTTVSSRELYPTYREFGFAPHTSYPVGKLQRTEAGEVIVAMTTDEDDPAQVRPFPESNAWYYGGMKVTQYWKASKDSYGDDLRAVVNARFTYWQSRQPIPGGIAFENFEFRERFHEGQRFVFGITRRTPEALGFARR